MRVRDVKRAFTVKLGAEEDKSGDHIYYYLSHQGSDYTVGKLSHSWTGSLGPSQISMLAKKLNLRDREFVQFVDCCLSADDTIASWQDRWDR